MRIDWELPKGVPSRMLGVAAVFVCIALGYWWSSAPVQSTPIVAPRTQTAAAAAYVIVDVVGDVRRPGVVRVPADARVLDAIAAAGGVLARHDPVINLARHVVDGEQIVVGAAAGGVGAATASGAAAGRLDLNAATAVQLEALPGIGAVLAQRIVDYRTQHGPFRAVRDLLDVPGIGDAKYASLADGIAVG